MLYKLQEDEIKLLLDSYKKPTILKDDWILVNKKEYDKNKNKITLTSADFYLNKAVIKESKKEYLNKQIFINAETKNKYIMIKYNGNFIAVNVSDTEYGLSINPMKLICAKNVDFSGNLNDHTQPPSFLYLLDILDWKISTKALKRIKDQDDYF